jgi:hypothetical protein
MKIKYCICLLALAISWLGCAKSGDDATGSGRLVKIATTVVDSVGNDNAPRAMAYQFFSYDNNGRLASIRDSSSPGARFTYYGPVAYPLGKGDEKFQYNSKGELVKLSRDSLVYNAKSQAIQKYRRVISPTSAYTLINTYTYDTQGRLLTDSGYTTDYTYTPFLLITDYYIFTYDAAGNIVKADQSIVWPLGSATRITTSYTKSYDTKRNPFESMGIAAYTLYRQWHLIGSNNVVNTGYSYEYYPNGLIKKISLDKYEQEYFYQ